MEEEVVLKWLFIYINVDIGMGWFGVCIEKDLLVVVKVFKLSIYLLWDGIFIYFLIVDEFDIELMMLQYEKFISFFCFLKD